MLVPRRVFQIFILVMGVSFFGVWTGSASELVAVTKSDSAQLYKDLLSNPRDPAKLSAWLRTLPRLSTPEGGSYYVFEGDLLLTSEEVEGLLIERHEKWKERNTDEIEPELVVRITAGADERWSNRLKGNLTYVVDRQSFGDNEEEYAIVVDAMSRAVGDWERACSECAVKFRHLQDLDTARNNSDALFVVRRMPDSEQIPEFIATAFFPSDPSHRRYINIFQGFFDSPYPPEGTLRHELGHVLGYDHEHKRSDSGCAFENGKWRPLSEYDDRSVMHYVCGYGGNYRLRITGIDIKAHRQHYGVSADANSQSTSSTMENAARPAPGKIRLEMSTEKPEANANTQVGSDTAAFISQFHNPSYLFITFRGGNLTKLTAQTMKILHRYELLRTVDYQIQAGETVCEIYLDAIPLPGGSVCDENMINLSRTLNSSADQKTPFEPDKILAGDVVRVARPVATTFKYVVRSNKEIAREKTQDSNINTNWASQIVKNIVRNDISFMLLKGLRFRIRFSVEEVARAAAAEISRVAPGNVFVSVALAKPEPKSQFADYAYSDFIKRRTRGELTPELKAQGHFIRGWSSSANTGSCEVKCRDGECTSISLIDSQVKGHPDLKGAIQSCTYDLVTEKIVCNELGVQPGEHRVQTTKYDGENVKPDMHGTIMSAIMVSQDDEYDFVGISPESRILAFDRAALNGDIDIESVVNEYSNFNKYPTPPIFVFASVFDPYADKTINNTLQFKKDFGGLHNEDIRTVYSLPNDAIANSGAIWIIAAGQVNTEPKLKVKGRPIDDAMVIGPRTPVAPMNMGDHENVIVVTACEDCSDHNASLWPGAHYSEYHKIDGRDYGHFVHVAAPGHKIPSLADEKSIVHASGTSPATAFVGGLVARMINCYPQYYLQSHRAVKIKEWLQFTSRPSFSRSQLDRIAGGIADPALALLDPTKTWLRRPNRDVFLPVEVQGWCRRDVHLSNPEIQRDLDIESGYFNTKVLRRIARYRRPSSEDDAQWVFMSRGGPSLNRKGTIRRFGPGDQRSDEPFVRLKIDGTGVKELSLNEIDDLILNHTVKTVFSDCVDPGA